MILKNTVFKICVTYVSNDKISKNMGFQKKIESFNYIFKV